LLSFQPDESIAQVLAIRDYEQAPYLVLATRNGLVKKTRLSDYNSPRQAGVIAINFREDDDELIGAELVDSDDDILLVSRKGQAIRFRADDTQLRPMGRATSGVTGMKFRNDDQLLSMAVIRAAQVAAEEAAEAASGQSGDVVDLPGVTEQYVFTITDGGFAKRTRISQYRLQSRGGLGIKTMKQDDERGNLVGAFIVVEGDEVLAIKQSGQVTRSAIDENLRPTGRDTKGVKFVGVSQGDGVAVVARSVERAPEIDEAIDEAVEAAEAASDGGSGPAEIAIGSEPLALDATIGVDGSDAAAADDTDEPDRTESEES
jgi:DNA gyrase subunit A